MIFGSRDKLTPGSVVKRRWWRDRRKTPVQPEQPFYVIREATREEWAAQVIRDLGEDAVKGNGGTPGPWFYEVSTD